MTIQLLAPCGRGQGGGVRKAEVIFRAALPAFRASSTICKAACWFFIIYDDETLDHLAQHGVTIEDFQAIVNDPSCVDRSESSGRVIAFGFAADGRFLACVYEYLDESTILPFSAYEVES